MSHTIDHAKKQFESQFLRNFSALTKLSQSIALKVARDYVEDVLIMFNDGYSPLETARYLCKLIDVAEIKDSQYSMSVSASWR